jgi:hypothetical protein
MFISSSSVTKAVPELVLPEEMAGRLGYCKHDPAGAAGTAWPDPAD